MPRLASRPRFVVHAATRAALCVFVLGGCHAARHAEALPTNLQLPRARPLTLPCGWQPGEAFPYVFVATRSDTGSSDDARVTARNLVNVRWHSLELADYDTGFVPSGGPVPMPEFLAAFQGTRMEIELEGVVPVGLRNYAEVARQSLAGHDFADVSPRVLEMVQGVLANPAMGNAVLLGNVAPFFKMICTQWTPGRPYEGATELPNVFGGDPLPAVERYELAEVDGEARTATVRFSAVVEPEALAPVWVSVMAGQGADPGASSSEITTLIQQMDLSVHATHIMSLDDGMPVSITVARTVKIPDHHRVDVLGWTRL